MTHAGCGGQLILRPVAPEHLAYLEQRDIRKAAIGFGLHRGDQTRQQARPHVGQIRGDGIGERELSLAATEQFGLRLEMNDQVTASTMLRAASARLARRVRSWMAVSTGLRGASPRSNGVIGTLSTPRCARSPRRCRPCRARPIATKAPRSSPPPRCRLA